MLEDNAENAVSGDTERPVAGAAPSETDDDTYPASDEPRVETSPAGAERLSAAQVAALQRAPLVDVRPLHERHGTLGYLPGSASISEQQLLEEPSVLPERYPDAERIILVCLSGKRSAPLAEQLSEALNRRVCDLEGGVLAWRAAGYPLCGIVEPAETELVDVGSLAEFRRAVLSCFVAESVETQLDAGTEDIDDPSQLVQRVFDECGEDPDTTTLLGCLDQLSEIARFAGHPIEHIASNVDRMRASLLHTAGEAEPGGS